jgi:hypothetical protein
MRRVVLDVVTLLQVIVMDLVCLNEIRFWHCPSVAKSKRTILDNWNEGPPHAAECGKQEYQCRAE